MQLTSLLPSRVYLSFIFTTGGGSSLFCRFTSSSTACSIGSGLNFFFRHSAAVSSKAASRAFCCSYTEPVCRIGGACGEEGHSGSTGSASQDAGHGQAGTQAAVSWAGAARIRGRRG